MRRRAKTRKHIEMNAKKKLEAKVKIKAPEIIIPEDIPDIPIVKPKHIIKPTQIIIKPKRKVKSNSKAKPKKLKKLQRWDAILSRLPDNIPLLGAEIGVLNGNTAHRILEARPQLVHIMVDPWKVPLPTDSWSKQKDKNASKPQSEHNSAYKTTMQKVAFAGERGKIMRMGSKEAAPQIAEGTLDFVFIDGDHSYDGTKTDIVLWLPKIKKGGWIGGHDYHHEKRPDFNGVDNAVDEMFEKNRIETDVNHTWFVRV